jgi:hypothetical protein
MLSCSWEGCAPPRYVAHHRQVHSNSKGSVHADDFELASAFLGLNKGTLAHVSAHNESTIIMSESKNNFPGL